MLGLFKSSSEKIKEVDQATARSFSKVKTDINTLSQWVSYLYSGNQNLQEKTQYLQNLVDSQALQIHDLEVAFSHIPRSPGEIKKLVDSDFSHIANRLRKIEEKIDLLESKKHAPEIVHHYPAPAQPIKTQSSTALKDKLMRRLARSSKDYIKNVILGLITKYGRMSPLQLRDIVIDEQGLCSKSSFYRILEEMEGEKSLVQIKEGKRKVFIPSSS